MYNVLVKDMPGFDLATFYVYSVMLKKKKNQLLLLGLITNKNHNNIDIQPYTTHYCTTNKDIYSRLALTAWRH